MGAINIKNVVFYQPTILPTNKPSTTKLENHHQKQW